MTTALAFDYDAMISALDAQRREQGLDWNEVADELYEQSLELNVRLGGNRMCSGALVRNVVRRGPPMSCQYALIIQRWIGRAPEEFLTGSVVDVADIRLPEVGPGSRLRWDLPRLHAALDEHRVSQGLTWTALAGQLGTTASRLTNLRTARQADLDLVLRLTQHLGRSAASFMHPADW